MRKKDAARKRLSELESDPKHTVSTPLAEEQTRNDALDDPSKNKPNTPQDPKWYQDADGDWHHPDYEGGE